MHMAYNHTSSTVYTLYLNTYRRSHAYRKRHMCIFAFSHRQTFCLHSKCHIFLLIPLPDRKMCIAHWHIFSSIALCHSVEFQMHLSICVPSHVCREAFVKHTPTHYCARIWIQVQPNLCLPFLTVNCALFPSLSPPFISHCHSHLFCVSVSAFLFWALGKKITEKEKWREKERKCRVGF